MKFPYFGYPMASITFSVNYELYKNNIHIPFSHWKAYVDVQTCYEWLKHSAARERDSKLHPICETQSLWDKMYV